MNAFLLLLSNKLWYSFFNKAGVDEEIKADEIKEYIDCC